MAVEAGREAFEAGLAAGEILASWKKDAVKDAVAARFNDRLIDLSSPVTENGTIGAVDVHTPEGVKFCDIPSGLEQYSNIYVASHVAR